MFKVGVVVRLKSGGPAMTIREVLGNLVTCIWFVDGLVYQDNFVVDCLEYSHADKTHSMGGG